MPYIKQEKREEVDATNTPVNCGELNWLLSIIIHNYIRGNTLCYATLNEVIGVLECCKLELYRQIVAPYENEKKLKNGNISDLDKW